MTRAEEAALKAYPAHDGASEQWKKAHLSGLAVFIRGYKQAEKDLINRIRKQVKTWMPEKDGEEYTAGKRIAFRSILILLKELEDENLLPFLDSLPEETDFVEGVVSYFVGSDQAAIKYKDPSGIFMSYYAKRGDLQVGDKVKIVIFKEK